jgi:uncharacterized protein (TIGR02246 family)
MSQPEKAAIAAVSADWKRAYNAGDVAAVAELYADDAVLSAPGAPPVLGNAAIRDYFDATIARFAASGLTVEDKPLGDIVTSGDLAWQWQTYRVVDRSGVVVDSGKLVTLLRRVDGRWRIAGDTWNSDGTAPATQTAAQR